MSSDSDSDSSRHSSSGSDSGSPPPKPAPSKAAKGKEASKPTPKKKPAPSKKKQSSSESEASSNNSSDHEESEKASSSDDGSDDGSDDDGGKKSQSDNSDASDNSDNDDDDDKNSSSADDSDAPKKGAGKGKPTPKKKDDKKKPNPKKKGDKNGKKGKKGKKAKSSSDSDDSGSGSGSGGSDDGDGDEAKSAEAEDDAIAGNILKGHLKKLGGKGKNKWQIRFFVLHQGELSYYLNSKVVGDGKECKGSIPVAGVTIHVLPYDRYKRQHAFTLTPADDKSKTYVLRCRVAQDRTDWITGLMAAGAGNIVDQTSDKGSSEGCHSGWLTKRGQGRASWKRRFFHLDRRMLEYFDTPERKKGRGSMVVDSSGLTIFEKKEFGRDFAFGLTQSSGRHAGKPRILVAATEEERVAWCNSLIKQGAVPDKQTSQLLQKLEDARKERLQSTSKVPTSQAKAKLAMCRVTLEGSHMGFITVAVPSASTVSTIIEKVEPKLKMKGVPALTEGLEYRLILGVQAKDAELLDQDQEISELGDLANVLTFTMIKHDPNAKRTEDEASGSDSDDSDSGSGSDSGSDFRSSGDDDDEDSDSGSGGGSGSGSGGDEGSASESGSEDEESDSKPPPKKVPASASKKKPAASSSEEESGSGSDNDDSDSAPPPKKGGSSRPAPKKKAASSDDDDDDSDSASPPPKKGPAPKKRAPASSDSDSDSDSD